MLHEDVSPAARNLPCPVCAGRGVLPGAISLTKIYQPEHPYIGNYQRTGVLIQRQAQTGTLSSASNKIVSLLRSLPDHFGSAAIPVRSSSSLPPSFAPGRFAAFLSSGRPHEQRASAYRHRGLRYLGAWLLPMRCKGWQKSRCSRLATTSGGHTIPLTSRRPRTPWAGDLMRWLKQRARQ
jgi:hypothetical protein